MAIRNGNGGTNFLFGTFGDDTINGRGGNDFLFGLSGRDKIQGGNGDDWMFGGFGNDNIIGGSGDDIGFGGAGNDRLVGGKGSDRMFGGSGDDKFVYRAEQNVGETDFYSGGSGDDLLILRLNADEAADTDIQADIAAFEAFIAAGGGGNFTFESLGLTVNGIESLTVRSPDPEPNPNTAPMVGGLVDLGAIDENTSQFVSIADLLFGATDADGDTLSVSNVVVTSENAQAVLNDGGYLITPDADDESVVTLSYTISDGRGASVQQSATLDLLPVAPINTDPSASAPENLGTIAEDSVSFVTVADLTANVTDAENDPLSVSGVSVVSGDVTVRAEDGGFIITPGLNFNTENSDRPVTLSYTVEDGQGGTVIQTANLEVSAVNDAPVAPSIDLTVGEDGAVTFRPSDFGSDVDGDALTFGVLGIDIQGQAEFNFETGVATYTPGMAFNGLAEGEFATESFGYTVSDGPVTTTGTVNVTIEGENDAPVAADDPEEFGLELGELVIVDRIGTSFDVLANDFDPDGDTLEIIDIGPQFGFQAEIIDNEIFVRANGFGEVFEGLTRIVELDYTISDGALTDTATLIFGVPDDFIAT